jgi:DNA-binding transcriptional MocR family regulator
MDGSRIAANQLARQLAGWDLGTGALHTLLADALRDVLAEGGLTPGSVLPSRRELARVLAVSRMTVGAAYDTLKDEGWVSTRHGAGTRVRMSSQRCAPDWHGDRLRTYAAPDTPLDLSSGALPASPLLSRALRGPWTASVRESLLLDRFVPRGLESTREAVADAYTEQGLATTKDDVVLTNGSHHALSIVADVLVQPGDTVLVEDPTYRGALDVLGRREARVVGVPCDEEGIDPLALETAVRRDGARLLYVLPTAHNVTGVTWSPRRRREVADVIARTQLPTIDDGSTADLHAGQHPGHLGALVPPGLSISIGSLTKLFWAGIRVGWIRGSAQILDAAIDRRVTTDLAGSVPSQVLTAELLPLAAEARDLRRAELAHTRELTVGLLSEYLPEWTYSVPDAGACLWVDAHTDTVALAARLSRARIVVIPGSHFSPTDNWTTHLRLPLGRPATLERAIPAIAGFLAEWAGGPREVATSR